MNITEILNGEILSMTIDEQKNILNEMKEIKIFDLNESQKNNLINCICEILDKELAMDYLFYILDEEITYPIDDEKIKYLFSDKRMLELKDLMLERLQTYD
jgi:Mg/Co/Ni transporter MgtE